MSINKEPGRQIARLRKEAGYTQVSLAEKLFVSDKAVSKWERGLCLPDSALLSKLSMLLDADIEYIINGNKPYGEHEWVGEIRVDDVEGDIAGKPILHYLLSYFMLAGIKDVYIKTYKHEYVNDLHLEQYGVQVSYLPLQGPKTVVLYDKVFVFGANLTRYFHSFMHETVDVVPMIDGKNAPILFTRDNVVSVERMAAKAEQRSMSRGMICMPLNADAEKIIEIYEKYSGLRIADLNEIAKKRGLA